MIAQTLTIAQAYDLPRAEDLSSLMFVVKLEDVLANAEAARKLVEDYVVTPAVAEEIPHILDQMKQICDRGEDYGRFVHGSFGSGKSHFMAILGMLLEDQPAAWAKDHPTFEALAHHRAWIAERNLLVVRLHMLSIRGRETGLDRVVYEAFNQALVRRGKPQFEFLNVQGTLDEARREGELYAGQFWANLANAGVIGSKQEFEEFAGGSPRDREDLARAYLEYKGRDPASAGIDPNWTVGLHRIAHHASEQGFGGIVLLIDEFLLWLAEKSGHQFVTEINNLNVIVDHTTGQRAVPIFAFVARQRNLKEFFPDLVAEDKIHEHLDHHSKRFEVTRLEDVELRHIVKERVLRPTDPAAVARAVGGLAEQHQAILPALLGNDDVNYLKDVYPFHPALIETLVDVTSLMQRERSALRLLYELLVKHYPDLPLGEFLPVGKAFDAIFPPAGVEASKKAELLQDIHRQYYQRLSAAMRQMRDEAVAEGKPLNQSRLEALDQLVKTVLLAEVSPRLRGGSGLTIERLVQLNSVDVAGETYRGRVLQAATDLLALARKVPELQIAGSVADKPQTAIARYILGRVSISEVLDRARVKVSNPNERFKAFYQALKNLLGISGRKGFGPGENNEGDYEVTWRGTRRKGILKLGNIRNMAYADFQSPANGFRILIDYPWDDPGHGVSEDSQQADRVRKTHGPQYTVCWLPRHFSPQELALVTDLAAVRFLVSDEGQKELLSDMSRQDRAKLLQQAGVTQQNLEQQLDALLIKVYKDHGELKALTSDVDGSRPHNELSRNLEHIAQILLDRRYPHHPHFGAEPRKADIERLLKWMVDASEAGISVHYDEDTGKVLKTLAGPLGLVTMGQVKAGLNLDSQFIKEVNSRATAQQFDWAPIADRLADNYGFQPLVIDLFLCFLTSQGYRALHAGTGAPVDVAIGMPASIPVRLERGQLVDATPWGRARDLGEALFNLPKPPAHRALSAQDRHVTNLRQEAVKRRDALQGCHEALAELGLKQDAQRCVDIQEALRRLIPLAKESTDSFAALSDLLALWPDDNADPVRLVVSRSLAHRAALKDLKRNALDNLRAGSGDPELGTRLQGQVRALSDLLAASDTQQPLTAEAIAAWNHQAESLVQEWIRTKSAKSQPNGGGGTGGGGRATGGGQGDTSGSATGQTQAEGHDDGESWTTRTVFSSGDVNPGSSNEVVSEVVAKVREALDKAGNSRVRIEVIFHEAAE